MIKSIIITAGTSLVLASACASHAPPSPAPPSPAAAPATAQPATAAAAKPRPSGPASASGPATATATAPAGPAATAYVVNSGSGTVTPIQSSSDRDRVTYVVRADIDGHSRLTLSGRSARWFHIHFAAPGRHGGKNNPTIINGKKWFPRWPHRGENRGCHCHSSTFKKVMPRVPLKAVDSFFKAVSCRDSCSARYFDGALVIDFNDNPSSSDAWYKVKVTLTRARR